MTTETKKRKYKCPKCGVTLTLGNCYSSTSTYMCIKCAKEQKVKTYNKLEEKKLTCKMCAKKLYIGNFAVTPTTLICLDCYESFINSRYYQPHAKSEFNYSKFKCTITLIIIIIAVYMVTSFPTFERPASFFVQWGALVPSEIANMQLWRIITANLMHANIMHLLANSISIAIWGHLIERSLGSKAVFLLIIFSGLFTTGFSAYFQPDAVSLGASGIAYGLMTAFITYLVFITLLKDPGQYKGQMISFLVLVIVQIAYNVMESSTVDVWGHLGGAVAGFVFIILFLISNYFKFIKPKLKIL